MKCLGKMREDTAMDIGMILILTNTLVSVILYLIVNMIWQD